MPNPNSQPQHQKLIVVLHGYNAKPSRYQHVKKQLEKHYPGAKILIPDMKLNAISSIDPHDVVANVIGTIGEEYDKCAYDDIVLIGHSCGALLARKVYVYACGANGDAPFEKDDYTKPQIWASKVSRLVLLAGMNRGWTVNMHLSFFHALSWEIGIFISNFWAIFGRKLFIMRFRKGAPFITQLRIQWLSMLDKIESKEVGNAVVVQLLGTIDDMVSPEDNVDLITGNDFYYLEVPQSGHRDVLDMDDTKAGEARAEVFKQALLSDKEELAKLQVHSVEDETLIRNQKVTDVVFVIHGIRDTGYWTKKIARRVQVVGMQNGKTFETETSSYGYFAMLPFLLYPFRRAKVEWLMDQYTENRARYPNADFSYVGHSNGTYLLAKALEDYPACHFKNIVFAGSVVRQGYDWPALIKRGRVKNIVNLVASADWVVAIFPKAFQTMRIQDLGSGGHDGFTSLTTSGSQITYIKGSHGAGVEEKMWDAIANFIVLGPLSQIAMGAPVSSQNLVIKTLGRISPIIILMIITALISLGVLIFIKFEGHIFLQIMLIILYLTFIWKVITKF